MIDTRSTPAAQLLVVVAVCTFAIMLLSGMDAVMKGLVLAIGVYNTMLWRSILVSATCGAAWMAASRKLPTRSALRLHIWRGLVVCFVATAFFWGLARLPLAEAIALSFIAPLVALFLAALMLGERIGRTAIWGSVAGMAGVIVILVGKLGHEAYSAEATQGVVAILVSACFYAYNLILGRRQAQIARPLEIALFQNVTVGCTLLLAAPWLGRFVPAAQWPELVTAVALVLSGQMLMSWSYARAEAQYLIPTEYTAFVWAIILGWAIFGESVGWTTVAGAALIIVGCLVAARSKPRLAEPIEAAI